MPSPVKAVWYLMYMYYSSDTPQGRGNNLICDTSTTWPLGHSDYHQALAQVCLPDTGLCELSVFCVINTLILEDRLFPGSSRIGQGFRHSLAKKTQTKRCSSSRPAGRWAFLWRKIHFWDNVGFWNWWFNGCGKLYGLNCGFKFPLNILSTEMEKF